MPYTFVCAYCGVEFVNANHQRQYCSRECGYSAKRKKRVLCSGGCGTWMSRNKGSALQPKCRKCRGWARIAWKCGFCGKDFYVTEAKIQKNARRFCSNVCAIHGASRLSNDNRGRRSRRIALPVKFAECAHCSKWFVVYRTGGKRYCSVTCRLSSKIQANREWDRGLAALLTGIGRVRTDMRREVYRILAERDGARCGICGDPVDLSFSPGISKSNKPSIDHVIPRSRGGSDDLDNLALAHMGCNSRRKAMPIDVARQRFATAKEPVRHSWERYLGDEDGRP